MAGGALDSVELSSEAEDNPVSGTHEHPTPHHIPLLIPLETANVCVFIVPNIHFSYPCENSEVESMHTSGDPSHDGETECNTVTETSVLFIEQFVSGCMRFCDLT